MFIPDSGYFRDNFPVILVIHMNHSQGHWYLKYVAEADVTFRGRVMEGRELSMQTWSQSRMALPWSSHYCTL